VNGPEVGRAVVGRRSVVNIHTSYTDLSARGVKIRNIRFVGDLILNIHTTFLDDDVIIVTSSDNRTQSICVLFSRIISLKT